MKQTTWVVILVAVLAVTLQAWPVAAGKSTPPPPTPKPPAPATDSPPAVEKPPPPPIEKPAPPPTAQPATKPDTLPTPSSAGQTGAAWTPTIKPDGLVTPTPKPAQRLTPTPTEKAGSLATPAGKPAALLTPTIVGKPPTLLTPIPTGKPPALLTPAGGQNGSPSSAGAPPENEAQPGAGPTPAGYVGDASGTASLAPAQVQAGLPTATNPALPGNAPSPASSAGVVAGGVVLLGLTIGLVFNGLTGLSQAAAVRSLERTYRRYRTQAFELGLADRLSDHLHSLRCQLNESGNPEPWRGVIAQLLADAGLGQAESLYVQTVSLSPCPRVDFTGLGERLLVMTPYPERFKQWRDRVVPLDAGLSPFARVEAQALWDYLAHRKGVRGVLPRDVAWYFVLTHTRSKRLNVQPPPRRRSP